ncbi:hypothetical protein F2Q68_00026595 [Brassica cretica]|uniref:Uncharacterized protein n=1 Tax=Brassica cretica TaxID=69181 RepID=A0A8S9IGJ3_BRACR|nr:hypothetical protein F2Q68_00026595 [Brassica cretica]
MYPDILLKEAKATCFSRFPRLRASTYFQGKTRPRGNQGQMSQALTQGATHINKSHQHAHGNGDSRRGDESSNNVQKTLGMAHPSGGRKRLRRIIK